MNTDTTVGLNTSFRTAIIYKATHPSLEGVYVGCKLDSLEGYYTSSGCFDKVILETKILPTLVPIETMTVCWMFEALKVQPFIREQEIYDQLAREGVTLLNHTRPNGAVCGVKGFGVKNSKKKDGIKNVYKRSTGLFMYRMKVPANIAGHCGQRNFYHSLGHDEEAATKLAELYNSRYKRWFSKLRQDPHALID